VNLSNIQEIAKEVKKKNYDDQFKKEKSPTWAKLEYEGFDTLDFDEFLHRSEERIAHIAIKTSFSFDKPSNHLNNLRKTQKQMMLGRKETQ
jgi:hypothetical protein